MAEEEKAPIRPNQRSTPNGGTGRTRRQWKRPCAATTKEVGKEREDGEGEKTKTGAKAEREAGDWNPRNWNSALAWMAQSLKYGNSWGERVSISNPVCKAAGVKAAETNLQTCVAECEVNRQARGGKVTS